MTWVGVAGFEPAASSSRTKRAAKLRYTPSLAPNVGAGRTPDSLAETRTRPGPAEHRVQLEPRGIRVRRLASGRQANLAGAQGDVPSPADTCSQACPPAG